MDRNKYENERIYEMRNSVVEDIEIKNHIINNLDKAVSEGDAISMRGSGKAILAEVSGKTKKGRIAIVLRRYV